LDLKNVLVLNSVVTDLMVILLLQLHLWNWASWLEHFYWYICLVLEVPGLNFGQDLNYTYRGFCGFLQSLQAIYRAMLQI